MPPYVSICTKSDFRWGTYSAPPDHLAVFKGPTSKGREGEGEGEGKGMEREGREGGRRGFGESGSASVSRSVLFAAVGV